ncbi:putative DNA-binding domain-containing protein [Burkholderiaceae bacterium DAT-1]|nr:putative DNA-binding domain-containing protein [Burkholderiaceae bacterium DAT-1]
MSYADVLDDFARIYRDPLHHPDCVADAGCDGLNVYRRNHRYNRSDALASAYPTVTALLGEEGFTVLAHRYGDAFHSPSANLHADGEHLPAFILTQTELDDLPWLSDVATVDWALHQGHYLPDQPGIDARALLTLPESDFEQQRLILHPAIQLLASRWPVGDILAFHAGGPAPTLPGEPQTLWVWRDHYLPVTPAEAACLSALLAGRPIGEALSAAAEVDSTFDPARIFTNLFTYHMVIALVGNLS